MAYEPAPLDPELLLAELREIAVQARSPDESEVGEESLDLTQAILLGIVANPDLRALRLDMGVAEAQLVAAGLYPDPSFEWDAMDWIVDDTSDAARAGLGLWFPLPRPGELEARTDAAGARVAEVRESILRAEWSLTQEIQQEFLAWLAARERVAVVEDLVAMTKATRSYFEEARRAGASTGLEVHLAALQADRTLLRREQLVTDVNHRRRALNRLLGLDPATVWEPRADGLALDPIPHEPDVEQMVVEALASRPAMAELAARYEAAEAAVRLEVAHQYPGWTVGTGFQIELPFFSRFNRPDLVAAMAERERVGAQWRAAVHHIRGEVHDAVAAEHRALVEWTAYSAEVSDRVEHVARLTAEALAAGEITAVETLAAQEEVVEARLQLLESRFGWAQSFQRREWVTGARLLRKDEE